MNKEELIKQFDEKLQQLRDEFIAKLEDDKKEFKLTYPEDGETVYYIDSDEGKICSTHYFVNSKIDNYMFEHGLYFETYEEAKHFLKERKLIFKVKQWVKRKNDGWKPDWSDFDEKKYNIYCDGSCDNRELRVDWLLSSGIFSKLPYFKTHLIAQECIDLFGDEIKEVLVNA